MLALLFPFDHLPLRSSSSNDEVFVILRVCVVAVVQLLGVVVVQLSVVVAVQLVGVGYPPLPGDHMQRNPLNPPALPPPPLNIII